jgi:hypothetical protein
MAATLTLINPIVQMVFDTPVFITTPQNSWLSLERDDDRRPMGVITSLK